MLSARVYQSTCVGWVPHAMKCVKTAHELCFSKSLVSKLLGRNFGALAVTRNDYSHILVEPSLPSTIQFANRFSSGSMPKISVKREELLKHKDGIPSKYSLIYKVAIHNYVMYGQRAATAGAIALIGSGLSEAYQAFTVPLSERTSKLEELDSTSNLLTFIKSDSDYIVCYVALLCTVMGVQSFVSKLPLRIYHEPSTDEYIAVFVNLLGLPKTFSFSKGEVHKLPTSGITPWKDCKFSMKSKTAILLEHYFRLPEDYNSMLNIGKDE